MMFYVNLLYQIFSSILALTFFLFIYVYTNINLLNYCPYIFMAEILIVNLVIRIYPTFYTKCENWARINNIIYGFCFGGMFTIFSFLSVYFYILYLGFIISLIFCIIYLFVMERKFSVWQCFILCITPCAFYHFVVCYTLLPHFICFIFGFATNCYFAFCLCLYTHFTFNLDSMDIYINFSSYIALKFGCDLFTYGKRIFLSIIGYYGWDLKRNIKVS